MEKTKELVAKLYKGDDGKPFILTPGQVEIFDLIFKKKYSRIHCETPTRYGKLISDDTSVYTTKGWKKHGELKVGDYVFNHKGKSVRIKNVMPKGKANLEVKFTNGEKIKCHSQHQWLVNHKEWKNKEYKILETNEILKYRLDSKRNYLRVPNIKPLEFEKKDLIIHPYVLGIWLGDGTYNKNCITHSKKDREIINKFDKIGYKRTGFSIHKITGVYTSYFRKLYGELIKEGFLISGKGKTQKGNKRIPKKYLLSSVGQRIELLAGLIDSDGSVRNGTRDGWKDYRILFINTDINLIEDVRELIRGLGMRVSLTRVKKTISSTGINGKKDVFILGFTPVIDIPTSLPRKKVKVIKNQRHIYITEIKEITSVQGNCIELESEDGIYLVGKNHIPTHNSEAISLAVLTRVSTFPEKWAIVAGEREKAGIIMNYIIKHIFDNDYTKQRFVMEKGESEESIKRHRNKSRINFKLENGLLGEIFITTANAAMGLGAPNVVEDESALINEKDHALVMRMLGDQPENFLVKVGNPWDSEHFDNSREDPNYKKVIIRYPQAIKEGRLTPEYVEEMRKQPFFGVLYECQRPPLGTVDEEGWIPLITKDEIKAAFVKEAHGFGINKLGVDVAGGGRNFSVIVQRFTNYARIIHKTHDPDTMNLAEKVIDFKTLKKVRPMDISMDKVAIGKGLYDILSRDKETTGIRGINAGEKPTNKIEAEKFVNLRAEMFWKAIQWIKKGGKLLEDDDWFQLARIKYRTKLEGTKGKMVIMPKEMMLKKGIDSPDVADSLALTFVSPDIPYADRERTYLERTDIQNERVGQEDFNPFSPWPSI